MSNLATRLQDKLYEQRLSVNAFAKKVGLSQQAISKIIRGETLNPKNILEIATVLGVDPNWLKTGKGDRESGGVIPATNQPDDQHTIRIDQLDAYAVAGHQGFENAHYPDVIRSIWFSQKGLLDVVGIKNPNGIYLISVPTDSMSPTINKGDVVFVDTKIDTYSGEGIYVFDLNGETYIKRLQRIPTGVIRALSDNKTYEPFDIFEELFNTAVVRGKFIRVLPINPKDL